MKEIIMECEKLIYNEIKTVDKIEEFNSAKVLKAFINNKLSEGHLNGTTGYGYGDSGRDIIEKIYSDIFQTEDALVRGQFISGTHALTVALFGLLRPNDLMLSICGKPYDTLDEVIGIRNNSSSLKSFGVNYDQIDLINDDFNYKEIENYLKNHKVKLIEIQRSKGYSTRKSLDIKKLEKVIKLIKKISKDTIIMVDNCYCEFVDIKEPSEVGADITVGSLIKNLGGGIAPNGAYIVGKKDLIHLCSERLNVPGEAKEVGPSLNMNKYILQGLFFAPMVVANSLKTAIFASALLEKYGFKVEPSYNDKRVDIVQNIFFNKKELLISFVQGIQKSSPIDSSSLALPSDMPGYDDQVIMAAGCFNQGSSIELSCDGPLRDPYIAYLQGSISYPYGKIAVINALKNILEK